MLMTVKQVELGFFDIPGIDEALVEFFSHPIMEINIDVSKIFENMTFIKPEPDRVYPERKGWQRRKKGRS